MSAAAVSRRSVSSLCFRLSLLVAGFAFISHLIAVGFDPVAFVQIAWWKHQVRTGDRAARTDALRDLGNTGNTAVLPFLLDAMHKDDFNDPSNWRASFAVMRFDAEAVPYLDRAIEDEDPNLRKLAILMLVALRMNQAGPFLRKGIRSPDPEVRKWTLLAALNRGLAFSVRRDLAIGSFEDPDPGVRAAAFTCVRDRRDADCLALLQRSAGQDNLTTRSSAEVILAQLGYKENIPRVIAYIGATNPHELHHEPVGQYAAQWLVRFIRFIRTRDNSSELLPLLAQTRRVADGEATPPELTATGEQWKAWWEQNSEQLSWNERDGWLLARRE